jgi:alanine-synthesizing transaminase
VGLSPSAPETLPGLGSPLVAEYRPLAKGALSAREAILKIHGARPGLGLEDILVTASTSEAYAHLFRILCEPGDEILVPRPSYPLFEPLATLEDVRVEHYRLSYDERWTLDLDSLEAAISPRTRAIVVVQPNNPTGSCLSRDETAAIASLGAERGIAIISDEVFGDFPWPHVTGRLPSFLDAPEALTFVLGGLSKSCGLPQMKLAWIVARGPEAGRHDAMRRLEWVADLFLTVSSPAQAAMTAFLRSMRPFQAAVRARLNANLSRLQRMDAAGYRLLRGEGGWSATIATPPVPGDYALQALEREDVLLHPGHFYDAPPHCAVLSLLPEPAVFDEACGRLERLTQDFAGKDGGPR